MSTATVTHFQHENQFGETIASPTPTLVDFWASWCGPCQRIAPILDDLSAELAGKVRIAKVDVDSLPDLAERFRVAGIPTMILFANGREIDRQVGAAPKSQLRSWLEQHTD
jgi:thioredoxin